MGYFMLPGVRERNAKACPFLMENRSASHSGLMRDSIFQHRVASGDLLQDSVILWTRVSVPDGEDQQLAWAIAADPQFRNVVGASTAVACASDDHTVYIEASGLQAGLKYYYRFHAFGFQQSATGRRLAIISTLHRSDIATLKG